MKRKLLNSPLENGGGWCKINCRHLAERIDEGETFTLSGFPAISAVFAIG